MAYDIRPTVRKHSQMPYDRLRVVTDVAELRLPDIETGIIFIFAAWSGPAVVALSKVTKTLSFLKLDQLDIVVLDNDSMDGDEMIHLFGHVFSGAGETLWIKKGKVIAELRGSQPGIEGQIVTLTKDLFP